MTLTHPPRTVHLCTMTASQRHYEVALGNWLIKAGYVVMTTSQSERARKLQAARDCDVCILLLGPDFGSRDPLSPFSDAELEVSAAASLHSAKVLAFLQKGAEQTSSPEQRDFIERQRDFVGGTFQITISSPEMLIEEVQRALNAWQFSEAPEPASLIEVSPGSVMISSTGDLFREREAVRAELMKRNLPVIDYLHAPSEAATPIGRVISWARDCSMLILLLGPKYGYISPVDGLGVTELEFVTALRAGRPMVICIRDDAEKSDNIDQRQFLERVRTFIPGRWIYSFVDASELASVLNDVFAQLQRGYSPYNMPVIPADVASRWYRRQVQRWLGTLPHLTQPKGMPLKSIYISLQTLSSEERLREEQAKKDPRQAFSGSDWRDFNEQKRQPVPVGIEDALARYQRFVLRGDPGTGKSATLSWYAINAPETVTPVLIRLGAYAKARQNGSVSSLREAITQMELQFALLPASGVGMWYKAMENGKGLLLLDALDEAPRDWQTLVSADIEALANVLPEATRIVVTSRVAGFNMQLGPRFTVLDVQPLNSQQQEHLVQQWMFAAHDTTPQEQHTAQTRAQRLLALMEQDARLAVWARVPLLLTFLAALADVPAAEQEVLPVTKAEIYQRVLRLLLGRWGILNLRQTARRLEAKLDILLELVRLSISLNKDKQQIFTMFSSTEFEQAYNVAQSKWSEKERNSSSSAFLLSELSEQDGILSRLAEDQYAFIHPTFQEYLASTLIAAFPAWEREDLVLRRRLHAQWEEITQFLVSELDRLGRTEEADTVVWTLIRGDRMPIASLGWEDPLHLALLRAARCQGGRRKEFAEREPGPYLGKVLMRLASVEEDERSPLALQALASLGAGATSLLPDLSRLVRNIARNLSSGNGMLEGIATILRWWGPKANPVLDDLYRALADPDEEVRSTVSRVLFLVGPDALSSTPLAIDSLRQALRVPDYRTSHRAAQLLGQAGASALPAVEDACQMLCFPDEEVSARGSLILIELYPMAIPALGQLLHHPNPAIREKAANDLFSMMFNRQFSLHGTAWKKSQVSVENAFAPIMNDLFFALRDPNKEIRSHVSFILRDVLHELGDAAAPLFDGLRRLLNASIPYGREEIAEILRVQATTVAPSTDVIRQALHTSSEQVRQEKSTILDNRRSLIGDPDKTVRKNAVVSLSESRPVTIPMLIDLCQALSDSEAEVRAVAYKALQPGHPVFEALRTEGITHMFVVRTLRQALLASDQDVRAKAATIVGNLGTAVGPLLDDLRNLARARNRDVRAAAFTALSNLGPPANWTIEELHRMLFDRESEDDKWTKFLAMLMANGKLLNTPNDDVVKALGRMGPLPPAVIRDLCKFLWTSEEAIHVVTEELTRIADANSQSGAPVQVLYFTMST